MRTFVIALLAVFLLVAPLSAQEQKSASAPANGARYWLAAESEAEATTTMV